MYNMLSLKMNHKLSVQTIPPYPHSLYQKWVNFCLNSNLIVGLAMYSTHMLRKNEFHSFFFIKNTSRTSTEKWIKIIVLFSLTHSHSSLNAESQSQETKSFYDIRGKWTKHKNRPWYTMMHSCWWQQTKSSCPVQRNSTMSRSC